MSQSAMHRRSFPAAQTSSAMHKSLLRLLTAEKGPGAADAWLRSIRMVRDDLEDETRPVPLATLHHALAAFAEVASRDAIAHASSYLVQPDSLGVWVRMLRGTTEPSEAFARLDAVDSQHGRTTRWETLEARHGHWKGRVTIAHDPAIEQDGLLRLGRLAELAAVPALFGYSGASAKAVSDTARSVGIVQDFEVVWAVPNARSHAVIGALVGAVGAGAAGAAAAAGAMGFHGVGVASAFGLAVAGAVVGGVAGSFAARDTMRRVDARAQHVRVLALERGLALREAYDRNEGGLEGSVVAGQYRVVRRMGSGATGVIYEAVRISDGLPVAMKLLRAAAAHDAVASDRLRREAEALGLAWHPNVVEVIDHGHLPDGTAYLVMELLVGESLAARVKTKGRLLPAELLPIALEVCSALAAVHAAGVVHRDLKPSNIFLTRVPGDPATERVKLLDFGIARVEWEETRITNTGGPLGTPGYMSPEQEAGTADVDARSDLFALGALLYECLVGEPPPPQTPSGMMRMPAQSGPRTDSGTQRAAAFVPPRWRAIIDKATAPLAADRYPDARTFGQALRALESGPATESVS